MSSSNVPSPTAPSEQLLELINGSWKSQVIAVAAQLGLADLIRSNIQTVAELAKHTKTHAPSLRRLLNGLATLGLCRPAGDDAFALTPLGELLATDAPGGLRFWAIWWGLHLGPVWGNLLYSVQTGRSARTLLTGSKDFDHLSADAGAASIFNQALAELSRLMSRRLLENYDFSGIRKMVDVGGGSGEMLVIILTAYPDIFGVVMDMPHVGEAAKSRFAAAGVGSRCQFVEGDFFKAVESGGDAYLLKSVIHDWDDERATQILRCCREAMGGRGKLLVVEQMLPQILETTPDHQSLMRSDLNMLVALGAGERTELDLRHLLEAAGFKVNRVLFLGGTFTLMEAVSA